MSASVTSFNETLFKSYLVITKSFQELYFNMSVNDDGCKTCEPTSLKRFVKSKIRGTRLKLWQLMCRSVKAIKKNVIIMIQARTGSKRFRRKVIAKIMSKPMMWHIINRVKKVRNVHQIILVTTRKKEDRILLKIAKNAGIIGFAGNTYDVLSRYYQCALKHKADVIVRITGDC